MRRPLLTVCLCLIAVLALREAIGLARGTPFGEGRGSIAELGLPKRGEVTVTGRVYQKDTDYFYLNSIVICLAEDPRQSFQVTDNCIVEQQEWERGQEPLLGSVVTVEGVYRPFSEAGNPGEFDQKRYYHSLGIGCRLTDARILSRTLEYSGLRETLYRLRKHWERRLYAIFPQKEASVMATILLGERAGLDREIRELYQRNGIVHILSISGLHITVIGVGIHRLLRRLGAPVWLAAVCGGGTLILYGLMTGMSVSVCRAVGMYLLRMLAELTGRTYDLLTALGAVGAVMLLGNVGYLFHSGFWLSYGSVLGAGVVSPAVWALWEKGRIPSAQTFEGNPWKRFILKQVRRGREGLMRALAAGGSVTLTTMPLQLWIFYEVPVYSVLLNLLVLPFMSVLMLAGAAAMLVPGAGAVGTAAWAILAGYERLCGMFDRLPFHTWNPGKPTVWQIALYYALLSGVVWLGSRPKEERKKNQKNQKKDAGAHRGRRLLRLLGWAAGLTILVSIMAIRPPAGNSVTFLDVGQGDGICLRTSSGAVYLFDGGSSSRSQVGRYVLKPYLKYYGLSHVDAVFVSHPDADHVNGIVELIQNRQDWGISVDRLVLPAVEWQTEDAEGDGPFGELLEAAGAGEHPISVSYVREGDFWQCREVCFRCLHPSADPEDAALWARDTNAASECFYVTFPSGSLLLTGDVQGEGERCLLEELKRREVEDVTVLKVAHHGSRGSTPRELLEQIAPRIAVISSGRGNRYGHPHRELTGRLKAARAAVFGTAEKGAVTVTFAGDGARVYTYR